MPRDPAPPIEKLRWEARGLERHLDGERHYRPRTIAEIVAATDVRLPDGLIRHRVMRNGELVERAVGRKIVLRYRLEEAAIWYTIEAKELEKPHASILREAMERIEQSAERLRADLGLRSGDDSSSVPYLALRSLVSHADIISEERGGYEGYEPRRFDSGDGTYFQWRGEEVIRAAIQHIEWLGECARIAGQRAAVASQNRPLPKGPVPNDALVKLISSFAAVYELVFERAPGTSQTSPAAEVPNTPSGPFVRFVRAALAPLSVPEMSDHALRHRIRAALASRALAK